MQASARPWLPANAMSDPKLNEALCALAEGWARRWFRGPRQPSLRMSEGKSRPGLANDTLTWVHADGGLLLAMGPNAHVPLAGAMLGLDCSAKKLQTQDHTLLRTIASACARDFLQQAAALFGRSGDIDRSLDREPNGRFRFSLSLGPASQLLELFVEEDLAIAARRALAGRTFVAALEEGARERALDPQAISLSAMVGRGRLALGELNHLAPGDVLVLDRGPSDDLELAVDGLARARSCRIVEEDAQLKLCLDPSINGGPT